MNHTDILNHLIKKYNYESYLEIGVQAGHNFKAVKASRKIGVDPDPHSVALYKITSDKFFMNNTRKYDLIFVDGLHHAGQVYLDILNALKCLETGGTILVHDLKPSSEDMQRVPRITREWTGDGWKAWCSLRSQKIAEKLTMYVIDSDYGCGVIQAGKGEKIKEEHLEYADFAKDKKHYLNLITVPEFLNL